jgi:hypothetical protein
MNNYLLKGVIIYAISSNVCVDQYEIVLFFMYDHVYEFIKQKQDVY